MQELPKLKIHKKQKAETETNNYERDNVVSDDGGGTGTRNKEKKPNQKIKQNNWTGRINQGCT